MPRPPAKSRPAVEEFDLEAASSAAPDSRELDLEQLTRGGDDPGELDLEAATKRASGAGDELDLELAHLSPEERAQMVERAAVEKAIASLEGRDPSRALGDLLAKRERDRFQDQVGSVVHSAKATLTETRERRRKRLPIVILGVAAVLAVGIVAYVRVASSLDARAKQREATAAVAAPYGARGFVEQEFSGEGALRFQGVADQCYVAVVGSTEPGARLRVERDGFAAEGAQVGFCSCGSSSISVSAVAPDNAPVAVYAAPVAKAGGGSFIEVLEPRGGERLGETGGSACVEALLDRHVGSTPVAAAPQRGDVRSAALVGEGLELVGGAEPDARFVVLPAKPKTCFVVDSSEADEALSLRLAGGEAPLVESPVIALCQDGPVSASVWRSGQGKLSVYAAELERVGGSVGLAEVLRRAGAAGSPIFRTADVVRQEPSLVLASSGILSAYLVEGGRSRLGLPDPPHVFAFAASDGSYAAKVPTTRGAIACTPELGAGPAAALCLGTSGAFDGLEGLRAERPPWLPASTEPEALARMLDALSLARRLKLAGFELTTADGVSETPTGAELMGRADEKQAVAIALSAAPPYLHTLSDAEPWTVDSEPRFVPVSPGGKVALKANPPFQGPRTPRSFIVFRR